MRARNRAASQQGWRTLCRKNTQHALSWAADKNSVAEIAAILKVDVEQLRQVLAQEERDQPGVRSTASRSCLPMKKESSERGKPPLIATLLWSLLSLVMWLWAIAGPLNFAAGVFSRNVGASEYVSIRADDEAMALYAILGAVGVYFVWLRMRRYLKFGNE